MTDEMMADDSAKPKRQRLTLEQRIARLDAQKQRLLAQAHRSSRKRDTRQKIIVGAAVLNAMHEDAGWRQRVAALLNDNVKREIDREVIAPWLSRTSTSQ